MIVSHEYKMLIGVPLGIGLGPWVQRLVEMENFELNGHPHSMLVPEEFADYTRIFMHEHEKLRIQRLWSAQKGRDWEGPAKWREWFYWYLKQRGEWHDICEPLNRSLQPNVGMRPPVTFAPDPMFDDWSKSNDWMWALGQDVLRNMFAGVLAGASRDERPVINIAIHDPKGWKKAWAQVNDALFGISDRHVIESSESWDEPYFDMDHEVISDAFNGAMYVLSHRKPKEYWW